MKDHIGRQLALRPMTRTSMRNYSGDVEENTNMNTSLEGIAPRNPRSIQRSYFRVYSEDIREPSRNRSRLSPTNRFSRRITTWMKLYWKHGDYAVRKENVLRNIIKTIKLYRNKTIRDKGNLPDDATETITDKDKYKKLWQWKNHPMRKKYLRRANPRLWRSTERLVTCHSKVGLDWNVFYNGLMRALDILQQRSSSEYFDTQRQNQKSLLKRETYPVAFVDDINKWSRLGEAHHYGNWNSTIVSARTWSICLYQIKGPDRRSTLSTGLLSFSSWSRSSRRSQQLYAKPIDTGYGCLDPRRGSPQTWEGNSRRTSFTKQRPTEPMLIQQQLKHHTNEALQRDTAKPSNLCWWKQWTPTAVKT